MTNALSSRDDPLGSLKTAVVSDLSATRHAIDLYEMARAGEGLRRLAGILDMAMLPMAQRFCDEIALLTLAAAAGAVGDPQAARRLAGRAIRALCDYLDGISEGAGMNPMRFLPLLGEMAKARGVSPVSAHDPCSFDIPVGVAGPLAREADAQEDRMVWLKRLHETYQRGLLRWFQGDAGGLAVIRGALGGVLRTQPASRRALWWVASALVEGLQMANTDAGPEIKKLCARVEQELRRLWRGAAESDSPLLSDVLYAIATTCPDGPRAREVSAWYGLDKVFSDTSGREVEVSADGRSGHEAVRRSLHAARDALERFHGGTDGALDECIGHVSEARHNLRTFSPGALTDLLDAIANRAGSRVSDQTDRLALDLAEALIIADEACRQLVLSETMTQSVTDYANKLRSLGTASRTPACGMADALRMIDATAPVATEILKRLRQAQHLLGDLSQETVRPSEIDGLGDSISQCAAVFDMLGAVRAEMLCALCAARIPEVKAADWAANDETMTVIAEGISGLDLYCTALEQDLADPERPLLAVFERLDLADPGTPPGGPQDLVEGPAPIDSGDPGPSENPSLGLASRVSNGEETIACAIAATGHAAADADVALPGSATLEATAEVVIGDAVMSVALFESFAGEALVHHQTLKLESEHLSTHGLCEIRPDFLRASHTLAGISRTAGLSHIGDLAGALEQWLQTLAEDPHPLAPGGRDVMWDAIATLGGMIDAARRRQRPEPNELSKSAVLMARIDSLCAAVADSSEWLTIEQPPSPGSLGTAEGLDTEILAFFVEEASELLSAIGSGLRAWRADPSDNGASQQLLRVLHNFKGSAHTVGAVHLCRLAHDMEDRVEALVDHGDVPAVIFDALDERFDHLALATEALPVPGGSGVSDHQTLLRIRAEIADRLVNQAGEINIARSRIETEMEAFERGLSDLAVTTGRVRGQLHEIAIQAESQLQSRLSQVKSDGADFDPLEFDRYTRLQELTRMIAEGVSDVATVQQGLALTLEHTTASLAEQRRIDREHHRDLMRLRAAPFSTITERLYRAVRQAARGSGKKVELTIRGGHVEISRTVLERMIAPLEHVLRNAVVHGIEPIEERRRAGKPEVGIVTVALRPEATEIRLTVSDDGAGLDIARIRDQALARGLITPEQPLLDEDLMQFIFSRGFSTAEEITGLSGRGVGMDIVMSELGAIGGCVKVTSKRGNGAYFSFFLPVTLGILPGA